MVLNESCRRILRGLVSGTHSIFPIQGCLEMSCRDVPFRPFKKLPALVFRVWYIKNESCRGQNAG